ncbi:MAG TPA: adventurous gliding motility protein CglE [Myxococcales bacterium]|nr:adventurous gliding motility protein CglE [Myxococcales bacterium]
MQLARGFALLALGCVSLPAVAQQRTAVSEAAAPAFQEVERGGYAGAAFGFALTTVPGESSKLATGSAVDVELGYDLGSYFGLGAFLWAAQLTTPSDATLGDFSALFPGAEVRFYLPIASDGNGVKRLFFDVRAGGGVMLFEPGAVGPGATAAGRLGISIEYFTRLRHFSVGLGAEGIAAAPGGSVMAGGTVSPFARYSF